MTFGSVGDLLRRALGDLAAEVEHDDLVGDAHHHRHVVLDEQHRQLELVAQPPDQLRQLVDLGVGQPAGRLVEHQQLRVAGERPGDLDALQRAERQPGRRLEGDVGEAEALQQLERPHRRPALLAARAEAQRRGHEVGLRARVGADHHVLAARVMPGHSARFWNVRKMPSSEIRCGRASQQVLARRT